MALSLPGERSVAAGSHAHPFRALIAWLASAQARRVRRAALADLMALEPARLRDLGITQADLTDAMLAGNGRTPGMVLNAARARSAHR